MKILMESKAKAIEKLTMSIQYKNSCIFKQSMDSSTILFLVNYQNWFQFSGKKLNDYLDYQVKNE